jgi:hypothetical protein
LGWRREPYLPFKAGLATGAGSPNYPHNSLHPNPGADGSERRASKMAWYSTGPSRLLIANSCLQVTLDAGTLMGKRCVDSVKVGNGILSITRGV